MDSTSSKSTVTTHPRSGSPTKGVPRWRRGGARRALVAVVSVVVSLAVSAGCGLADLAPAERSADAFGAAVAGSDWPRAAAMLCGSDRSGSAQEQLSTRYSVLDGATYRGSNVSIVDVNGHTTAQAALDFTTTTGLDTSVTVPLRKEDNTWRPCP